MRLGILNLKSIKTRITFASTAIFVFGIWILSYYAGTTLQQDAKKLLGEQQASTLAYISSQIDREIQDRIHVLGLVSSKISKDMLDNPKKLQHFLDERLILKEPLPVYGDDEITMLINGFNKLVKALNIREEELKSLVESEVLKRLEIEDKRQKEQTALIQNEKMAQLGNMLGAIIHQWKQPLSSIAIEVQDIKYAYSYGELDEKKIEEIVSKIMGIIGFMIKTADDFRNFYKPAKERKNFSVIEEIGVVSDLLSRQLQNMDIALSITGDPKIEANGCSGEFKQVILNLLNNAKEAFGSGDNKEKRIDVSVSSYGEKTILIISDNAGGIPPELLQSGIFEQFSSTKGEAGTGIGLAISKTIIEENMGGKISAKNVNGGAEFMIELPKAV